MGDWSVCQDYNGVKTPAKASQEDRNSKGMDGDGIVVVVKLCTL